jgi:hypothetical protein
MMLSRVVFVCKIHAGLSTCASVRLLQNLNNRRDVRVFDPF